MCYRHLGLIFMLLNTFAPSAYIVADPIDKLSRQCLKIWSQMGMMIEYKQSIYHDDTTATTEALDTILCRLVRVRDLLGEFTLSSVLDLQKAEYVGSSLDCIESYAYDLIQQYPGSWSDVIQAQIMRVQDAYNKSIMPLITK